ncbi:hypothetical protein [Thermostichus vulcanus]|uniref:Prealbumin-like fold domain-containing protein n=1 Tax=Thermostichus vulcanus str. 'Rupite' TaxID=2813851 RepID=A0ABT0CF27_THEVL|nr:hypothetical protein [Thermostichus vulcanus]MCJ2544387.1 hypothetical protein [Thermostichus vulcanus str. 'Rupite']
MPLANDRLDPAEGETDATGEFTTQATILDLEKPLDGRRVYRQVTAPAEYTFTNEQGQPIGDPGCPYLSGPDGNLKA